MSLINITSNKSARGFSLIEMLIALFLSSVVIGGTYTIFVKTKKTQRFSDSVAKVQESGRFILEYLKRDIRMVGYQGCISFNDSRVNIIAKDVSKADVQSDQIRGYKISDDTWNDGYAFSTITRPAKVGTSAFSIARMEGLENMLLENMNADNANIKLSATPDLDIQDGELIFISDCQSADLFRVTNNPSGSNKLTLAHANDVNISNRLSKPYLNDEGAKISRYTNTVYFIGDTQRQNPQGEKIYALYQAKSPNFTPQEIIEGIEHMQLLYGEQLASGNIRYVPAEQTGPAIDWNEVVSVKLAILLSSHNGVRNSVDNATYDLLGIDVGPPSGSTALKHSGNRRLKKVVSTTIKIRNRGL